MHSHLLHYVIKLNGPGPNTTLGYSHFYSPSPLIPLTLLPGLSLPLYSPTRSPSLPLLPSVLRPLVDPGDKGASATLCVGSGRLVSRIGRLFETASRVDIALVTNEKVGSSNVDASTWLRLRRSGSPWRKEELFVLNHGYLEKRASNARQ
ncbi:hypothetical protein ALC62_11927 [Cyphomyrmex costatus]|uniref:Uncharacterized protein n=1 Tax=Cyphomyrmex costatus TaxID=456900 RepID=A0A195CA02_9HYME|nr:hypothetical protein ALC62_11927 [Cyphomyrmex costatus]